MHNRSVSENVIYYQDGVPFTGKVDVLNGKLNNTDLSVMGDSLLLGADLTGKAFSRSVFGEFGQYIVAIGLLLFAFSTAVEKANKSNPIATMYCPNSPNTLLENAFPVKSAPKSKESPITDKSVLFSFPFKTSTFPVKGTPS